MFKKIKSIRGYLLVIMSLLLVLSACAPNPDFDSQFEEQVVVITQVATQIVVPTNPPRTATPVPTATPSTEYISSGGFDPFAAPIYYPLTGCSASRLHVGDTAYVAYSGGLVGLYRNKGLGFEPNLRLPDVGSEAEIIDGPFCNEGWIYWEIVIPNSDAADAISGYMPEGNGSEYFLLPLVINPIPTMDPFSKAASTSLRLYKWSGCRGAKR
jgi:hypothetical protein